MQRTRAAHILAMLAMGIVVGCSKKEAPPAPTPAPEEPGVYRIDESAPTLTEKELPTAPANTTVRADFNRDNLEDVALAETDAEGKSLIAIYFQKSASTAEKQFFKAVTIRESEAFDVSAMMSRKSPEFIDLVAILNYADGRKDMVHYRGEGTQFREIQRESLSSAPAAKP